MKEEWLMPDAVVPVDADTTAALVAEIKRLIGVVGDLALQQALAQPEQEPVAWVDITDEGKWSVRFAVPALSLPDGTKFYTAPPKREWVGLTDEEIHEIVGKKLWDWEDAFDIEGFSRAIEAKLKEKNGG